MKAFISYSHKDSQTLERLHTHLAHLVRDGKLTSWTDEQILAGSHLDSSISKELQSSQLFIALLSPDYLASNYCYEREFKKAVEMNQAESLLIVPVIAEPCDWLHTPFREYKALPQDGKPISTWENGNTAFLNVTQSLRKLLEGTPIGEGSSSVLDKQSTSNIRNYRVKKDFDSIEKLEFVEKSFKEMVEVIKRYSEEINSLENTKTRTLKNTNTEFQCMLVNRNKIASESQLHLAINGTSSVQKAFHFNNAEITYILTDINNRSPRGFALSQDDYHLFWTESNMYFGNQQAKELSIREMVDIIWLEWLESVGIMS